MPIHGAPHYLFAEEQVHLQGPKVVGGRPKHRRNERLRFGRSSNRCPRSNSCAFLAIFFSPFRSRFRTSPITHPAYQTGQDSPISAFQRPTVQKQIVQPESINRAIDRRPIRALSINRAIDENGSPRSALHPPTRAAPSHTRANESHKTCNVAPYPCGAIGHPRRMARTSRARSAYP